MNPNDIKRIKEFRARFEGANKNNDSAWSSMAIDSMEQWLIKKFEEVREEEVNNLTHEQRQQIALEEYKKQRFGVMTTVVSCLAAEAMVETNATRLKTTVHANNIKGKEYEIEARYTLTSSSMEE